MGTQPAWWVPRAKLVFRDLGESAPGGTQNRCFGASASTLEKTWVQESGGGGRSDYGQAKYDPGVAYEQDKG